MARNPHRGGDGNHSSSPATASVAEVRDLIAQVSDVIPKIELELDRIDQLIRQRRDQAGANNHSDPKETPCSKPHDS